jgi:hypothetical protein
MSKSIIVYILKKKHDVNGNPIYHAFIPDLTGKKTGLRKLKTPHTYSFSTYNVDQYLRTFVFKNHNVIIER